MVDREALIQAARAFLVAVAEQAGAALAPQVEHTQRSEWMVKTGPASWSSQVFERQSIHSGLVSMTYQTNVLRQDFPERRALEALLQAADIHPENHPFGYLWPLVRAWLATPSPLPFDEKQINPILEEFADAAADGIVVYRSRDALHPINLTMGPLTLEEGVTIRPVAKEELWDYGEPRSSFRRFRSPMDPPYDNWIILDIQHKASGEGSADLQVHTIRRVVLTALPLLRSGSFTATPLGLRGNYGLRETGSRNPGRDFPRSLRGAVYGYFFDEGIGTRLKEAWPRLRKLLAEEQHHYLRLPPERLVEGLGRQRPEDALIDFSIGLEALLMRGLRGEMAYRFALRGATILAWSGGEKGDQFRSFRDFYDVRSALVHGGEVDAQKIAKARSFGEEALRQLWWWFFNQDQTSLKRALDLVDKRILA